ncbi:MAG: phosphohistidine phosphatase SixA [Planctomycetota bacterium]|nr:phosphohistidine phosphatase SixA [Planctomycetota bacterium]
MHLYLMRHGIAEDRQIWYGPDRARPLTAKGRKRTRAMVLELKHRKLLKLDEIWTSPLTRAKQTAEVVKEALDVKVREIKALACGATVEDLMRELKSNGAPDRLILVGHEPDMGYIYAELSGLKEPFPFKKAGVALLAGEFKPGGMAVKWYKRPKDLLSKEEQQKV